jgi:hypothetical protein
MVGRRRSRMRYEARRRTNFRGSNAVRVPANEYRHPVRKCYIAESYDASPSHARCDVASEPHLRGRERCGLATRGSLPGIVPRTNELAKKRAASRGAVYINRVSPDRSPGRTWQRQTGGRGHPYTAHASLQSNSHVHPGARREACLGARESGLAERLAQQPCARPQRGGDC